MSTRFYLPSPLMVKVVAQERDRIVIEIGTGGNPRGFGPECGFSFMGE